MIGLVLCCGLWGAEVPENGPVKFISGEVVYNSKDEPMLTVRFAARRDLTFSMIEISAFDKSGAPLKNRAERDGRAKCTLLEWWYLKAGQQKTVTFTFPEAKGAAVLKCSFQYIRFADGTQWLPKVGSRITFEARPKSEENPVPAAAGLAHKPAP